MYRVMQDASAAQAACLEALASSMDDLVAILLQVCGCGLHLMRVGVSGAWCLLAACVVLVLDLRYLCFELFQDTRFGVCCAVM
jgi:hypothetical protein